MMQLIEIARETIDEALKRGASQAETSVFEAESALTRYTKNIIHQNIAQQHYYLNLEVVVDKNKRGSSGINSLEAESIDEAVERAIGIAKVSTPDPDFQSYVSPKPVEALPGIYVKETAEITPEKRAEGVMRAIQTAQDYNKLVKWSAGSYSTEVVKFAIANSLGVGAETAYTHASLEVHSRAGSVEEEGAGFCVSNAHDIGDIDVEEVAKSAAKDAVDSVAPKLISIGTYEAVFPPEAVSTFIRFIGSLGFSARAYQEGYSFLTDRIGSQIFDEKLTIHDDGRSLETYNALPFDGEGTPKRRLRLVSKGVAENLCYDNYTARKDGTESTGHALPKFIRGFFMRGMPLPTNQVIEPGDATVEEMIEDTKKGVYITRLHYVNPIRRDLAIISGLTRDACWYIENGEIKHPIKVMRFTDSVISVMGNIDAMGNEATVRMTNFETIPAIKVAKFKFTGQSEF